MKMSPTFSSLDEIAHLAITAIAVKWRLPPQATDRERHIGAGGGKTESEEEPKGELEPGIT